MASMQDTFQKLKTRFRGKGNQLFVIGMVVLLGLRVVLSLVESNAPLPQPVDPPVVNIPSPFKPNDPVIETVNNLTKPLPEFVESPFRQIGNFNVFDPKTIINAAEIEKVAKEKFTEAHNDFIQGKYEDARRANDEALNSLPSYGEAQELKKKIDEKLAAAKTGTASATPAAPTPAAASTLPAATPAAGTAPQPAQP